MSLQTLTKLFPLPMPAVELTDDYGAHALWLETRYLMELDADRLWQAFAKQLHWVRKGRPVTMVGKTD